MKHLNPYKLFESSDEEQYLRDIFQELIDIGFGIKINNENIIGNIKVTIWKIKYIVGEYPSSFKYGEISEYINSSKDYMKSTGYEHINLLSRYTNLVGWNDGLPNSDDITVRIVVIQFLKDVD